jgi:hypothetical protein
MQVLISNSAEGWDTFWFLFGFCTIVGALVGGGFDQKFSAAAGAFLPRSFKCLVAGLILGGLVGGLWGSNSLRRVYKIDCESDRIALFQPIHAKPTLVAKAAVIDVRPRLVSSRGSAEWAIRIYVAKGDFYETSRLEQRQLKPALEAVKSCLAP